MQPNYPNNPYSRAGVPNYGGQPYPYPSVPAQPAQPGYSAWPGLQPQAGAPVPRRADMTPGSAIPSVMPNETQKTVHKKTTLSDGTVLPDVIYVKKKGTLIGLIAAIVLLVACSGFAIFLLVQNSNSQAKISELTTETDNQKKALDNVLEVLDVESYDEITKELLEERTAKMEGALDLDVSSFVDGNSKVSIKSIRLGNDMRYALATVNYHGRISYFYREIANGGWNQAFSRVDEINCRDITAEAMKVITDLGGVEKETTADGKAYDCLDMKDGKKPYDFADALSAGIYRNN